MDRKYVVIKGVELCWAYLAEPNTKGEYASGKYQVDVVINEDQKALLETLQFSPKQKIKDLGEGKFSVTLKSTVKPRVLDKDCMPMSDETVAKIGNGSIANVKVVAYETRGATFLGLSDIRVKNLIEYTGASSVQELLDDDETIDSIATDDTKDDDDDLA